MRCNFCGGPAHPATGCQYSENMISCYRCTVEAWSWVKQHTSGKGGRRRKKLPTTRSFYESIPASAGIISATSTQIRRKP